jgi:predicted metal-dependent peptidase
MKPEKQKKEKPKVLVPTDEEMQKVEELFIVDRMKFVSDMQFYGVLLMELTAMGTAEVPVGAVNYRNLYLHAISKERSAENKEEGFPYWELSSVGRRTLLAHEICHLVFEHLSIPRDFDQYIANIAQDAVINRILNEDSFFDLNELPEGSVKPIKDYNSVATGFTIGKGENQKTFNIPDFNTKDWIPIYWDIYKQLEKEAGGKGRENLAEAIGELAEKLAGSNPMSGDVKGQEDGGTSPEFEQEKARFRQKVVAVYEACKSQGTLPGEFKRYVDELEDGKVHWTTYLRNLLKTEISRDDFSHKNNSRRAHISFGGKRRPPVFPKVESEALGDVFLALDTSGSMSQKDISEGLSEFASLRQTTPFNLYFVSCDAQAYDVTVYERFEEPDWSKMPIAGGGGTDFNPVFDLVEKYRKEKGVRPALLVYFTDTMGSFPPQEPDYPVIWVCNYQSGRVPWGTLVSTVD